MAEISEKQLIRMLDKQAKTVCCNYGSGGLCYIKDRPCAWRKQDEEFSQRAIICRWFREAVLPADKELEQFYEGWKQKEIAKRESEYSGTSTPSTPTIENVVDLCAGCREPMTVKSNRQKYCEKCSTINRLRRHAARMRATRNK